MPGAAGGGPTHSSSGSHSHSFSGGHSGSSFGSSNITAHTVFHTQALHTSHTNGGVGRNGVFFTHTGFQNQGFGDGFASGGKEKNNGRRGFGGTIIVFILLICLFTFNTFFHTDDVRDVVYEALTENAIEAANIGEDASEIQTVREKADFAEGTLLEKTVEDARGYFSDREIAVLGEAMKAFYEITGIQPYLEVLHDLEGEVCPEYDTVDSYLYDKYLSLYEWDETHLLFLILTGDTLDENSTVWYIPGLETEDYFGYDACEELCLAINKGMLTENPAEGIKSAFLEKTTELMNETVSVYGEDWQAGDIPDESVVEFETDAYGLKKAWDIDLSTLTAVLRENAMQLVTLGISILAFVIVVAVFIKTVKKNHTVDDKTHLNEEVHRYRNNHTGGGAYSNYQNTSYPVTCPKCRATAYLNDDGCCQYCGTRLK